LHAPIATRMNQPYIVLEVAHSIHGRFKSIRLSHRSLKYLLGSLLLFAVVAAVFAGAYLRMSWRSSRYEQLQADFVRLQTRYQELQKVSTQRREAVTSLANLANEVSAEYGISGPEPVSGPAMDSDNGSSPGVKESIEQFNFLKTATYSGIYHHYAYQWQTHSEPSAWPVDGILRSSFGGRTDPLSGEGAFHTGIDLQAATGTAVHVTADGVVVSAEWSGNYGKLVVIDHGNGFRTYYAHLSQFMVVPGEEVRLGQVVALSGGTGRVTSAHLHYEVRVKGVPVNPYRFLSSKIAVARVSRLAHSDLGL
jgi:murein DD-endopeptidase MepM/ murein hydrolase activator NlpD